MISPRFKVFYRQCVENVPRGTLPGILGLWLEDPLLISSDLAANTSAPRHAAG